MWRAQHCVPSRASSVIVVEQLKEERMSRSIFFVDHWFAPEAIEYLTDITSKTLWKVVLCHERLWGSQRVLSSHGSWRARPRTLLNACLTFVDRRNVPLLFDTSLYTVERSSWKTLKRCKNHWNVSSIVRSEKKRKWWRDWFVPTPHRLKKPCRKWWRECHSNAVQCSFPLI